MRKSKKGINKSLVGPTEAELREAVLRKKDNPVISIKTNVCFEKKDCPLCSFRPYYGVELVFILFYADKTIQTVCYKCGKKVAADRGLKLPSTLAEIEYMEGVKDGAAIRKMCREMDVELNE